MPPAPSRTRTSPGARSALATDSSRRSCLAWMRQASMVTPFDVGADGGAFALRSVARVPALAESLVRLVQVAPHRRPRARHVVLGDRLRHRAVLGDRRVPQLRRVVMMLELLVERSGA